MAKLSKKLVESRKLVDSEKFYELKEAIKLAKEASYSSFDGSIDLSFNLNLDVRQADQQLRGAVSLPNGTGKNVVVLVATENAEEAQKARDLGAEFVVTGQELTEKLNKGELDFEIMVADPKMMPILGRFGRVLGPKGLMPNPKTGTVTPNVSAAVNDIKKGKANYRTDKNGIVNTMVGKVSMTDEALLENATTVIELIKKLRPNAVKGTYIKNLTVSASMGASVKISLDK